MYVSEFGNILADTTTPEMWFTGSYAFDTKLEA
uniref:Uncharacterized protein n=1 Tax=Anguilla anguilla TaxID=7936 RepID=A0A0E9XKL8_ANGAN